MEYGMMKRDARERGLPVCFHIEYGLPDFSARRTVNEYRLPMCVSQVSIAVPSFSLKFRD